MQSLKQIQLSPPPPTLRLYQKQFISDIYACIRAGSKRILGVAPTGSGKTIIASKIIADALTKKKRIFFIVHRDILIKQTYNKIKAFNFSDCGFIKSGWQENQDSNVQIASVQTLAARNWWQKIPADIVIIDEAHINAYAAVVQRMMAQIYPQAIYLALTGTPWRLCKHQSMGDIFDSLVQAPMPFELINQGFLVKPSYFSVAQADLDLVGTVGGDFDEGQLALACDRPELLQQIVEDWKRYAWGRRTIGFTVNVQHAQNLANAFLASGIPAAYVSAKTPAKTTEHLYKQLESGELLLILSCMKLTEGFDVPGVSAIISGRPTLSKALFYQMLGRGLRLSPETGKTDCIILDFSANLDRHGFIEDLKSISLQPVKDKLEAEAPKKICPDSMGGCGAIIYASLIHCPNCKYIFPRPKKFYFVPELQQQLSDEDLERYEEHRQNLRLAYERNFAPGWAASTYRERYGYWPPDAWGRKAIFGLNPIAFQKQSYRQYLETVARRKDKSESWVEDCMYLEFGIISSN